VFAEIFNELVFHGKCILWEDGISALDGGVKAYRPGLSAASDLCGRADRRTETADEEPYPVTGDMKKFMMS